jgi:hypothetical protein
VRRPRAASATAAQGAMRAPPPRASRRRRRAAAAPPPRRARIRCKRGPTMLPTPFLLVSCLASRAPSPELLGPGTGTGTGVTTSLGVGITPTTTLAVIGLASGATALQPRVGTVRKHAANPLLGPGPAYTSDNGYISVVHQVGDPRGPFRLWYDASPTQRNCIAHANSSDGIVWEEPHLGIISIDGRYAVSRSSAAVIACDDRLSPAFRAARTITVSWSPTAWASSAIQRSRQALRRCSKHLEASASTEAGWLRTGSNTPASRVCLRGYACGDQHWSSQNPVNSLRLGVGVNCFRVCRGTMISPDGIHWNSPQIYDWPDPPQRYDTSNNVWFDAATHRYIATTRRSAHAYSSCIVPCGELTSGCARVYYYMPCMYACQSIHFCRHPTTAKTDGDRAIGIGLSAPGSFVFNASGELPLVLQGTHDHQIYAMETWRWHQLYMGIAMVYDATDSINGRVHCRLVWSRDVLHGWAWVEQPGGLTGPDLIPLGHSGPAGTPANAFDSHLCFATRPVRTSGEERIYYSGARLVTAGCRHCVSPFPGCACVVCCLPKRACMLTAACMPADEQAATESTVGRSHIAMPASAWPL